MSNFQKLTRVFLLALFFYFVSMMVVMGNGHSFLGRYLAPFYTPVANSVGLNTTWNFFSPDPAQTMYLRYNIIFDDSYGNSEQESIEEFYPESRDEGGDFRLDHRRFTYALRWMLIDPERISRFFIPWKCRENPKATKIQVELVVNRIPLIETLITFKNENYENLLRTEELNRMTYDCPAKS